MSLKKQIHGGPTTRKALPAHGDVKVSMSSGTTHYGELAHTPSREGLAAAEVACAVAMHRRERIKELGDRLLMLVKIKEREEF